MKQFPLIFFLIFVSIAFAYDWQPHCSDNYPIYNGNFQYADLDILCSDGLLLRSGFSWELFANSDLPTINAIQQDEETLFVLCGNGSWSDGLYSFDLNTYQFEIIEWFPFPNVLYYHPLIQRYFIGTDNGLFCSFDGNIWVQDKSITNFPVKSINSRNSLTLTSNSDGIYRWIYMDQPEFDSREDMGLLEHDAINESSGLVASRMNDGVFWTMNDSGDDAVLYALNAEGQHLGVYSLDGITNRDWEDIAIGGGPDYQQYLYVGDIGDNGNQYETKYIYRVIEPIVSPSQPPVTETITGIDTIAFQYPDGEHDAETLMHDPLTNDLYIVSKRWVDFPGGVDYLYRAPYPQSTDEIIILEYLGELDYEPSQVPFSEEYAGATAGDISPIGDEILIKTYSDVYYWKREQNQSIGEALQNNYFTVEYMVEPQGEAICWSTDGNGYFTISEEPTSFFPAHLYYYDKITWELVNDYNQFSGFEFTSDGNIYAFMGEAYSSGLYRSDDNGLNWDVCFWDTNISSIALDCNDHIFIGWENEGVGIWFDGIDQPEMLNTGLLNRNINNLIDFPIVDCPSILACTESGAYFVTDYVDGAEQEIPVTKSELISYPNPFALSSGQRNSMTISFSMSDYENAELIIFNIKGQKIKSFDQDDFVITNTLESRYSIQWDGSDSHGSFVAPGVYLYRLSSQGKNLMRKMVFVK